MAEFSYKPSSGILKGRSFIVYIEEDTKPIPRRDTYKDYLRHMEKEDDLKLLECYDIRLKKSKKTIENLDYDKFGSMYCDSLITQCDVSIRELVNGGEKLIFLACSWNRDESNTARKIVKVFVTKGRYKDLTFKDIRDIDRSE